MKIVSRMIFAQIMKNSLFVLLTLVALFAFFDLIGQSGNIGTSYSMGQAFLLTALILPTRCYEVLPIAVMLGSIFTLSRLASTSQFTVLRVSGIGPWRFCGMLLMPGIVLVICAYLLGNLVAPPAQRLAKEFKLDISGSAFTGKELDSGIWVRDVQRNEAGEPGDGVPVQLCAERCRLCTGAGAAALVLTGHREGRERRWRLTAKNTERRCRCSSETRARGPGC